MKSMIDFVLKDINHVTNSRNEEKNRFNIKYFNV